MGISSTNKAPYEVIASLIKQEWVNYIEETEPVGFLQVGRPMLPNDPIPSFFILPVECDVDQRGIPEHKVTLDKFTFEVRYYTHNTDILFNVQQALKQIIISKHKVNIITEDFPRGMKFDWVRVEKFAYNPILISVEQVYFEIVCTVVCAYQDSYLE